MTINLKICCADEVVSFVQAAASNDVPFDAVISIEHPCADRLTAEQGRAPRLAEEIAAEWREKQLILVCWDVEHANFNVPAPEQEIVTDAMAFIDGHMPADRSMRLLIHCRSGKARSTALGLILLAYHNKLSPEIAVAELIKIRPIAAPNLAIVEHGDSIVGYNGKLVASVLADSEITERRAKAERARIRQVESRGNLNAPNA